MAFAPPKSRDDLPPFSGATAAMLDARAILTAAGEVAYQWTLAGDSLALDQNAVEVLGVAAERLTSGRAFAAFLDPHGGASRHEAILNSKLSDAGEGVRYELVYAFLPDGARGRRLIVEDAGRWYGEGRGGPQRAMGVMRVINERYEREQRQLFLSRYDDLTGYLNRSALLLSLGEALNGAAKLGGSIAFMIVAVDHFRAINEAYGFDVADEMFAAVAHRVKTTLRDGDAIGRFAGNKLAVVLRNCDFDDMPAAAERFQAVTRDDVIETPQGTIAASVSIGGVAAPRHARGAGEAVARAQEALHAARQLGSGRFLPFVPSPERSDRRRSNAALSADLLAAVNQDRFVLGYQPVVEATSRRLVLSEALLRMKRPNSDVVAAADFVTLAERLGLIRLVDERTLLLVFAALEKRPEARLSFNISGETVGDASWLMKLTTLLRTRRALASRLTVEITETALVRNGEEAVRFVSALKGFGCGVAIDDFGAGYSSFSTLRDLKIDLLKIDGSYVEHLAASATDQAFVRSLVALAQALKIKTVAEKVQDEAAAAMLAGWGVDYLQGNLIGEAMVAEMPPAAPA